MERNASYSGVPAESTAIAGVTARVAYACRVEYDAPHQVAVTVALPGKGELGCGVCGSFDDDTPVLFVAMDGAYEPSPGVCERCVRALLEDARARLGAARPEKRT